MIFTKFSKKNAWALLMCAAALASCSPKTNLAYFADTASVTDGTLPIQKEELTIRPNDELVINVTSEVPEQSAMYNLPFNNPGQLGQNFTLNSSNSRQQTYIVGKDGDIEMPILGKVHVAGLTTSQLAQELTKRISADVEDPYVRVVLINFKVKVIGEVSKPGSYLIDNERATVLDALAEAGDMTIFGKRDNVTIYREEDGQYSYHKLNLNDASTISSPYFYLKQNDVIYVEPGDAKAGQAEYNQNNSYKISVISTIVSASSVIASLVIALAVK